MYMSVWKVPPNAERNDLHGLCVYDYDSIRVFPHVPFSDNEKMTPWVCKQHCLDEGKSMRHLIYVINR